jgi:hypothetical protein
MRIIKSPIETKKYRAIFDDGSHTDFGASGYSDYTVNKDPKKREAYLARHRSTENWNDYRSAGSLSRWILWGDSTSINVNYAKYKKRFNL